ncbi:putative non-LTR retroelement reverse transcriptase, partial [Trifolium medium]|nr:putative non-LTR retroelement reverse transcriptase [Trifolium medium]
NRLGTWGNKFVSLGGRIVLLNSVLNAIPIFYLSYLKIPIQVWKQVRRIQREFLWGGKSGRKRINWVKWDDVCKPKSEGGLGVRDIRAINISLLTKWRWKLLTDDRSLWKEVIRGKYGGAAIGRVELGDDCKPWFSSLWWRDISSIGANLELNWFSREVTKRIGNGMHTKFWTDKWVGDTTLKERFLRLFSISTQKEDSIATLWNRNGSDRWNVVWRRRLFVWECNLRDELMLILNPLILTDEEDIWEWNLGENGEFTVKSTYELVSKLLVER